MLRRSTLSGRRSVSKFRLLRFAPVLGFDHVFDLLMRRIHVPLAMMPFPLIIGSGPIRRARGAGSEMGFPGSPVCAAFLRRKMSAFDPLRRFGSRCEIEQELLHPYSCAFVPQSWLIGRTSATLIASS